MQKLIMVAPGKVKILKNVRTEVDKTGLIELSKSIKENGLLQPITVRKGKKKTYELITGQRRLLAARMAKIGKIPAIEVSMEDNQVAVMQTIENTNREDLTEVQLAYAFVRMVDEDLLTLKEISIKMGVKIKRVKEMLGIKNLVPTIDKFLAKGEINLEQALTFGKFSKDIQNMAIGNHSWLINQNPKQIEEHIINYYSGNLSYPGFDMQDPKLNPKQGTCSNCEFNTANNKDLFDSGKDLCANIQCYNFKRKVTFEKVVKIFDDKKEKFYLISENRIDLFNGFPVLNMNEYRLWDQKMKVPTASAIIVDGNTFGKVKIIVLTSELKKIEKKEREKIYKEGDIKKLKEMEKETIIPDIRYNNKVTELANIRNAKIMNAFNGMVLGTKEFPFTFENVFLLFQFMFKQLDHSTLERVCNTLGIKNSWDFEPEVLSKNASDFNTLTKIIIQSMFNYSIELRNNEDEDFVRLFNFIKLNYKPEQITAVKEKFIKEEQESAKELLNKFKERWGRSPLKK